MDGFLCSKAQQIRYRLLKRGAYYLEKDLSGGFRLDGTFFRHKQFYRRATVEQKEILMGQLGKILPAKDSTTKPDRTKAGQIFIHLFKDTLIGIAFG